MVAPVVNTIPPNPNRIGGSVSTYPDKPSPFQKRNLSPQPMTSRSVLFTPGPPGGGGGGGDL